MPSTKTETTTRVASNQRSEQPRGTRSVVGRQSGSGVDGLRDYLGGIVRQGKEVAREVGALTGQHPLATQMTCRLVETLSTTPMGLMDIHERIRIWKEAKRTGRVAEAIMLFGN